MARRLMDRTEFRRLYDAGQTDRQIAERMGFAIGTVRSLRCQMGLPAQEIEQVWTDERIALLRGLAGQGMTAAQIAARMEKSASSVRRAASRFKVRLKPEIAHVTWTRAEDLIVADSLAAGMTARQIATQLLRSERAVFMRISTLRRRGKLPAARPYGQGDEVPAVPAKLAAVPVSKPVPARPGVRVLSASEDLVKRHRAGGVPPVARAPGLAERLAERHGARLIADLVKAEGYAALADVAASHGVPIARASFIWRQVRA